MKLFHLADLHFGKSVYGLSQLPDQWHWTGEFLELCDKERPDAVMIAGDVYDRAAPGPDAVELLDHLLSRLAEKKIPVLMIAGNHDSGQRLDFGRSIFAGERIHIAGMPKRQIERITFDDPDGHGPVTFWLVPYIYPEAVNLLLQPEEPYRTYQEAFRALLEAQELDPAHRNVIISHQNVVCGGKEAERGGSESMVGGVGQIEYTAYDAFDYAALGHIHSGYPVGREEVRYAGTPLCYHFNETRQKKKGVLQVCLGAKGEKTQFQLHEIRPLHRMRYLEDTKENIYEMLREDPGREEYIGIRLTDERIRPETSAYLHALLEERGSVLMELLSGDTSFAGGSASAMQEGPESRPLEDLFAEFYGQQSGGSMPGKAESELLGFAAELIRNRDPHEPLSEKEIEKVLAFAKKMGGETA